MYVYIYIYIYECRICMYIQRVLRKCNPPLFPIYFQKSLSNINNGFIVK